MGSYSSMGTPLQTVPTFEFAICRSVVALHVEFSFNVCLEWLRIFSYLLTMAAYLLLLVLIN